MLVGADCGNHASEVPAAGAGPGDLLHWARHPVPDLPEQAGLPGLPAHAAGAAGRAAAEV